MRDFLNHIVDSLAENDINTVETLLEVATFHVEEIKKHLPELSNYLDTHDTIGQNHRIIKPINAAMRNLCRTIDVYQRNPKNPQTVRVEAAYQKFRDSWLKHQNELQIKQQESETDGTELTFEGPDITQLLDTLLAEISSITKIQN